MHLERRADSKEVVPREHVATHDRMGVAHVDRDERHALTRQVERFVLPYRRLADLLPDEPPRNGGTDAPARRLHLGFLVISVAEEPRRRDPGSVSRHLRGRAVGVPDRDLRP